MKEFEDNQVLMDFKDRLNNSEDLTNEEDIRFKDEHWDNLYRCTPKSIKFLIPGLLRPGACERPSMEKPSWLDMEKFERGQKFADNNIVATALSIIMGLYMAYSFKDGLKVILMTGKSSTPFNAFFRYLRNLESMIISYRSNPWKEGTDAYKDVVAIQRKHSLIRRMFVKLSDEEVAEKCTIKNAWCPMREILLEDFRASCPNAEPGAKLTKFIENKQIRPLLFNQADMSLTQFAFIGMVILYPKHVGITRASRDDLDDFCHFWRGFGYLLGIEDEYNFCNGTLEDIQERARDVIEQSVKSNLREISPEWEHVTRCISSAVSYYIPSTYEAILLYFGHILGIEMTHLRSSVSYFTYIQFKLLQFYFLYFCKIPGVISITNKVVPYTVRRAMNYNKKQINDLQVRSDKLMSSLSFNN